MIKTLDEIKEKIAKLIGDDTSDESISILEDVNDTLDDLASRANGDNEDWKSKYEQNDAEWRKKYKERFTIKKSEVGELDDDDDDDDVERKYTYDELFKEDEKEEK